MDPLSLPDHPHGPYHTPPADGFIGYPRRRELLHAALANVELGAWDARIADWLIHVCDTPTFLSLLGLLQRTRQAGAHPPTTQPAAVELRVLDPAGEDLAFTWQVRDGHGRLLAHGQVAGAPNTPELAGWRYQAFTEAAHTAISTLRTLEAAQRSPTVAPPPGPHEDPADG